jgi:predicted Holliday junction resolvase-like endonuclease
LNNIIKGKIGEEIAEIDYKNNGYKIIRTGIGSDFIAIKKFSGYDKPYIEFVEVKTGKSRQSKKQKIIMKNNRKVGKNYTIYRVSDAFLDTCLKSIPGLHKGVHRK